MKKILGFILLLPFMVWSQNIQVDGLTYSAQQLIEDILVDSDCVENVNVTNVVGGNFDNDKSYGFFDATGTNFPFESGIVLSTGRLQNVQGPNTSLSDDDAPNWEGDLDLEYALNESNTTNATIIEFDFTAIASQISFRYIFASEEYQEGNANTCQYSDLFGFLIRPENEQQYTNIALVPNTQTPVKVTTVHPGIPNACPPINETYFGSWNDSSAPINFNGQTAVLTATADIVPNQTYHVKLVIADEQNYRYDSAVFLEAGSFELTTNLGPDRLLSTNNALCEDETLWLDATETGNNNTYQWFQDGNILVGETSPTYEVTTAGTYSVEIILENTCSSSGEIVVEYATNPVVNDAIITECDSNQDGITSYNLYNAESIITNNDQNLEVTGFYLTLNDAETQNNTISTPENFQNTYPNQVIFARIENNNGCFSIAEISLEISTNTLNIPPLEACDGDTIDGFATFNLNDITTSILNQIPTDASILFYANENDAFNNVNSLDPNFENTIPYSQTIYVKVLSNNQCYAIAPVQLNVLYTPQLEADETISYCLNSYPETITLLGGVLNDSPSNYYYEWIFNGNSTTVNTSFNHINEVGTYTVIVTDPNGCSNSRTITVIPEEPATIEDIIINHNGFDSTISIIVSGDSDYLFAMDNSNGTYQTDSTFYNVSPGFHEVYVKDINDCGIVSQTVAVIGFPKFFTPNGDTFHDTWQVYGVSPEYNQGMIVNIFNRYGKLIISLDNNSIGWDGTFNGKPLPSDDYWFEAKFIDGKTFKGHFSLIR